MKIADLAIDSVAHPTGQNSNEQSERDCNRCEHDEPQDVI